MRIAVATAVACLTIASLTAVADAQASIKRFTNIPAQELGAALQTLAKERQLSVVFVSDEIGARQTAGAVGEFTADEALTKLLEGSGLTYRYVNEETVTIVPVGTAPAAKPQSRKEEGKKEAQEPSGFWGRFRVAQADQGASAQSSSVEGGQPDSQKSFGDLQEVVVTAQKREERLQDVPISIAVLSGRELDRAPGRGVTDALVRVPGVVVSEALQSGATVISMRGIDGGNAILTGGSPISYYLDGVPFGFVRQALAPDPNAYDLDRIEVLRGPQGTLYGANAAAGVVRVLTKNADLDNVEAKARLAISDTEGGGANYRVNSALNMPVIEGKLAVRLVAGYDELSGWVDRPDKQNANDGTAPTLRLKVRGKPTDKLDITASVWHSRSHFDGPNASNSDQFRNVSQDEPIDTGFDLYSLPVTYDFKAFSASSYTSYLDYSSYSYKRLSSNAARLLSTGLYSKVFSEEVNLRSTGASWLHWTAGGIYREGHDKLRQAISTVPAPPGTNYAIMWDDSSASYAVFGELNPHLLDDRLEFILGLRYFHDDNANDDANPANRPWHPRSSQSAVTPRIGLNWHPTKTLTAYATYSQGFRSGYPQSASIAAIAPNFAALRPDKMNNFEVGAKGSLFDRLVNFDVSAYYMNWTNKQQNLAVPITLADGNSAFVNAAVNSGGAKGPGVDVAVDIHPVDGLSLGGAFSWNDLKFSDVVTTGVNTIYLKSDRVPSSFKYTYGGYADYEFPVSSLLNGELSVSLNYRDGKCAANTTIPAVDGIYTKLCTPSQLYSRASMGVSQHNGKYAISLFVDNMLDKYRVVDLGTAIFPDDATYLRPRTYGLQLEYRY